MDLHHLSNRLGVGIRPRLRRIWKALDRMLFLRFWFPHVPLFLAVAIFGILELSPVAGRFIGLSPTDLLTALQHLLHAGIRYTPQAAAGLLLVIMSVGLLMRSRLAWTISLLLASVSLLLFLIGKGEPAYWVLVTYNIILLAALLLGYRYFRRSSLAAASLFAFISVASVLVYAVLGITVFATSLSTLLMPLINRRMETLLRIREGKRMERANHYIIIGRTALAQNAYRELKGRNQKVTFVFKKLPEDGIGDLDIVVGDPCAVETLEKAGVARAAAVLALSDEDSDNAFVVLAVKDMASNVKTVTVANDAGNLARMKRVRPDLIIAPQILGGELLAMALTGERVDSDRLMKEFLHLDG